MVIGGFIIQKVGSMQKRWRSVVNKLRKGLMTPLQEHAFKLEHSKKLPTRVLTKIKLPKSRLPMTHSVQPYVEVVLHNDCGDKSLAFTSF